MGIPPGPGTIPISSGVNEVLSIITPTPTFAAFYTTKRRPLIYVHSIFD